MPSSYPAQSANSQSGLPTDSPPSQPTTSPMSLLPQPHTHPTIQILDTESQQFPQHLITFHPLHSPTSCPRPPSLLHGTHSKRVRQPRANTDNCVSPLAYYHIFSSHSPHLPSLP
ncbi:hypothetical protein BGS_0104 [Beggiatoa sp. SS]|nr:hypothetical protein BGS_0104 [Beggiatoa sp. SS]